MVSGACFIFLKFVFPLFVVVSHNHFFLATDCGQSWRTQLGRPDARRGGVSFGRYWGATEPVSCLHFEACYYQPLAWCIAHGFRRFEGGAQGEHKMARGLLPVQTQSAHWLAHPQFAQAVAEFLLREGAGIDHYMDELNERIPFKAS
jgi:predicted N-acyltransferase